MKTAIFSGALGLAFLSCPALFMALAFAAAAEGARSGNSNGKIKAFQELADEIYYAKLAKIEKGERIMKWGFYSGLAGGLAALFFAEPAGLAVMGLGAITSGAGCYYAFKGLNSLPPP